MGRVSVRSLWKKNQAREEVEKAKKLFKKRDYTAAKACMDEAIRLAPDVEDGLEMSILCETLYYGKEKHFPIIGIDWYSLLHLHPSVSNQEVESHVDRLIMYVCSLSRIENIGYKAAVGLLEEAVSVFRCESKRLEFDLGRNNSGLSDFHKTNGKGRFKEEYLGWKPPSFKELSKGKRVVECELSEFPLVKKLKNDQVFDEMPQYPHCATLNNYTKVCEDKKYMKKVLTERKLESDVALVKLYEEIRRVDNPHSFWTKLDGFRKQLTEFEEMGHNVEKLRKRLQTLKNIAERDRASQEAVKRFEGEVKVNEKKIRASQEAVDKFEAEIKLTRKKIGEHKSKIVELENGIDHQVCKINNLKKGVVAMRNEFASIAKSDL